MKNLVSPLLKLWPGFRGVVRHGLWDQLAIALLFGAICQLTLAVNFLWSDFPSNYWRATLGIAAVICWIFLGAVAGNRVKKYEKRKNLDRDGENFLEAQTHYLRGNWFETECCLKSVLKKNPYDAESLLLLATLYRHLKRFSEAKKALVELNKLDAAEYWFFEIQSEKKAIQDDERALREEEKEAREAEKIRKKTKKQPNAPDEGTSVAKGAPTIVREIVAEKTSEAVESSAPIVVPFLQSDGESLNATDDDRSILKFPNPSVDAPSFEETA